MAALRPPPSKAERAMEFDNSFEVPLPPAQAWKVLLDIERIAPCMPREWKHYSLSYRYADTFYRIAVERSFVANEPLIRATLDGTDLADPEIPLVDDRREHIVVFRVNQLT
jgi:hypothetical protein